MNCNGFSSKVVLIFSDQSHRGEHILHWLPHTHTHVPMHTLMYNKRVYISIYKTEMYPQITLLISNEALHFFNGKKKAICYSKKKKHNNLFEIYCSYTAFLNRRKEEKKERKTKEGRKIK